MRRTANVTQFPGNVSILTVDLLGPLLSLFKTDLIGIYLCVCRLSLCLCVSLPVCLFLCLSLSLFLLLSYEKLINYIVIHPDFWML